MNVIGRLLMELREDLKADDRGELKVVEPVNILTFCYSSDPSPLSLHAIINTHGGSKC